VRIDINQYILLSKEERQQHLVLTEPCKLSTTYNSLKCRSILANHLNTTINSGNIKGRIVLCHACNNKYCINPKHLYWGTDYENIVEDGSKFRTWTNPWERELQKRSLEEIKKEKSERAKGNVYGSGNKGKPKSEEHKKKISEAIKILYKTKKSKGGRPQTLASETLFNLKETLGFTKASEYLGINVESFKSRYYRAKKKGGMAE
jgi:hypothetical protein